VRLANATGANQAHHPMRPSQREQSDQFVLAAYERRQPHRHSAGLYRLGVGSDASGSSGRRGLGNRRESVAAPGNGCNRVGTEQLAQCADLNPARVKLVVASFMQPAAA